MEKVEYRMLTRLCFMIIAFIILQSVFPAEGKEPVDEDFAIPHPDSIQIITMSDGSVSIGRISKVTDETILFSTDLGNLIIPRNRISSIRTVLESEFHRGEYWFHDPNTTRLYFSPTGRMLPKGSGYLADYYLFFPAFNYGVSSKVSLGGGFSIFPTGNMADQIYYFTPKIALKQSERFNLAAGALVLKIPDSDEEREPLLNVLYVTGTWGSPDRSVTCGVGYGMVDTDFAEKPMIVLGGETRLTRRMAFVTENWVVPGIDNALVSYGIRFLTEKFTTDFALLNTIGEDSIFPGIPYIDFVYNF